MVFLVFVLIPHVIIEVARCQLDQIALPEDLQSPFLIVANPPTITISPAGNQASIAP